MLSMLSYNPLINYLLIFRINKHFSYLFIQKKQDKHTYSKKRKTLSISIFINVKHTVV